MNSLDVDHSNAVDKTVAGDQLAGILTMAATAAIKVSTAGAQILSQVANGFQGTVAGSIISTAVGAIQLSGGATDWPVFGSVRTRTIVQNTSNVAGVSAVIVTQGSLPANNGFVVTDSNFPFLLPSGGSTALSGFAASVVNSGSASVWAYLVPITALHNGATLTSANLYVAAAASLSVLPQTMPAFQIYRTQVTNAGVITPVALASALAIDGTGGVPAMKTNHAVTLTCNQNNTIDTSQYAYYAVIWDMGGTNSVTLTNYAGITLTYSSISNMAFP